MAPLPKPKSAELPVFTVGLTGGIGSGKSTVAAAFGALGAPVIDADEIGRELTRPGQPALTQIVEAFGNEVLDNAGRLKRALLRQWVFNDDARRARLEAILHPLIYAQMSARLASIQGDYCILCVPLLLESKHNDLVQRILVVDAPEALQYSRVRARDGLTDEEIAAVLKAQCARAERLARAHDVINNDGDLESLKEQVRRLHLYYQGLAPTHGGTVTPPRPRQTNKKK